MLYWVPRLIATGQETDQHDSSAVHARPMLEQLETRQLLSAAVIDQASPPPQPAAAVTAAPKAIGRSQRGFLLQTDLQENYRGTLRVTRGSGLLETGEVAKVNLVLSRHNPKGVVTGTMGIGGFDIFGVSGILKGQRLKLLLGDGHSGSIRATVSRDGEIIRGDFLDATNGDVIRGRLRLTSLFDTDDRFLISVGTNFGSLGGGFNSFGTGTGVGTIGGFNGGLTNSFGTGTGVGSTGFTSSFGTGLTSFGTGTRVGTIGSFIPGANSFGVSTGKFNHSVGSTINFGSNGGFTTGLDSPLVVGQTGFGTGFSRTPIIGF